MLSYDYETRKLHHVVEFIVHNTPGPHGVTPRDIDRGWSLATPLENELQQFTVEQFEPLSEYTKILCKNYRDIRVRVLGWLKESCMNRADLANRHRKLKTVNKCDEAVLRDPHQRKSGWRSPYRQPYTEQALVLE